ncbi:MAG: tetratricopeptide repeat protein, partial [Desulfobulbus sp.]|nr:tetratricopeptide repeat protein [Desulfobulbus sp.]
PRSSKYHTTLAFLHLRSQKFEDAKNEAAIALQLQPRNFPAALLFARSVLMAKEYDNAVKILEDMRAKVPNNVEVLGSLGLAYLGNKQPDNALKAFSEVLSLQPGNTPALVNVARIEQQKGKKKEDIVQLVRDQIKAAPDSAGNLMLLATMLMTEKQYDEALQLTRRVQELQPQMTASYTLGAEIYKRLDKTDEAINEYNKLLASGSNKLQAYMGLGAIHEQRGERELAKKQYQEVLKISPDFAPAANNLAWLMTEDEQPDLGEALRLALTAKQVLPEDAHIIDTLGMVHYKRGSFGLARAEFTQAVENRPDMPVFQYHLATALYGDGQKEEAITELREALTKEQPFAERGEAEILLKKWQAESGQ